MEMDEIKQKILQDVDPVTIKKNKKIKRRGWIHLALEIAAVLASIGLILYICWGFTTVSGSSMYPTLHNGDTVIYSRLGKHFEVGDVVLVERPNDEIFVKRIVAVAGDTVMIEDGKLFVNGKEIQTKQAIGDTIRTGTDISYPYVVPENQVFVIGDNRENSEDSRMFGAVDVDHIKGRIAMYIGHL
jgi:signal peptidase I